MSAQDKNAVNFDSVLNTITLQKGWKWLCPAPVYYPNWNARVFVKNVPVLISSSLEKLAFRENSNGVKYPTAECGRSVL